MYLFLWRLICALTASLLISLYWENVFLITILLIIMAILINIKSEKIDIIFYILVAVFATIVESVAMMTGAWVYTQQHILNFPIWLPLYWGMGGIVMKDLYLVMKQYIIKK